MRIQRKPNRRIRSEAPPKAFLSPVPHEKVWRELEDRGYLVTVYNGGRMLRINFHIDIYPKSLKWRYTHNTGQFNKFLQSLVAQDIINLLAKAPRPRVPHGSYERDHSPLLPKATLRTVRKYKKSI